MTIRQDLILKAFKKLRVPCDGALKPESLDIEIKRWPEPYQDEAFDALKRLVDSEYILVRGSSYVLTEKGYDYIYKDYSIRDTEKIILDEIRRRDIDAGNIIMSNWLNALQRDMEIFHSDNFNNAIRSLIDKGFIEAAEMGYKLTQEGYSEAYVHTATYNIAS
jgi:predicted transcriptional regulator